MTVAPSPHLLSRPRSTRAAVSSSAVRPATQRIARALRQSGSMADGSSRSLRSRSLPLRARMRFVERFAGRPRCWTLRPLAWRLLGKKVVIRKRVDHDSRGLAQVGSRSASSASRSASACARRKALDHDVVVVLDERAVLDHALGLLDGLGRIAGEHALIEAFGRRQRRRIAEQHAQELEPLDVTAEHDQHHRQRDGQQETDRSPQQRPERGGENDRQRRQAGALALHDRLDHVAHDRLGDDVERQRHQEHRPAGVDGGGEQQRKRRGDDRADERHEPHQHRQHAPQDGARDADHPQAKADDDAEGGVDGGERQEVAAEAVARVVHGGGGLFQVVRADEADGAVAHVLAPHQQEQHEQDHEAGRRQGLR